MDETSFTIELKCFFCDGILEGERGKTLSSGDMIECQNCKELNDYDALIDVASEEGISLAKELMDKKIKKAFSGMFKK